MFIERSKYKKAIKANEPTPSHKNSLPFKVMKAIKPTFTVLLKKFLHGKTQNLNKSFNNIIWSRIVKNNFVGLTILKTGVYDF